MGSSLCGKKNHVRALQVLQVSGSSVHGNLLVNLLSERKSEIVIYPAWKIIYCTVYLLSGATQPEKAGGILSPDLS